jgi:hypothetical protein
MMTHQKIFKRGDLVVVNKPSSYYHHQQAGEIFDIAVAEGTDKLVYFVIFSNKEIALFFQSELHYIGDISS